VSTWNIYYNENNLNKILAYGNTFFFHRATLVNTVDNKLVKIALYTSTIKTIS